MAMATQVQMLPAETILELKQRRIAVESALGSTLAEGVSPSPEVLALSERYASGEISLDQFGSSVRAVYGL
jgi:hypothetical protein